MNNRQKLVQQQFLNDEKAVIKRLNSIYNKSLDDINGKIKNLTFTIGKLQQKYDWMDPDDPQRAEIKSMIQSKIYQKQYQEQLQKQVDGILNQMQTSQFATVSEYLDTCYTDGFIGTIFDAHGQGVPIIAPINQEAMVRAVQLESKISKGLYTRLGKDVTLLKEKITAEVSRGISTGMTFKQVAKLLENQSRIGYNRAIRIARTEGHRIQTTATMDAMTVAKEKGADVLKQWDATMDAKTRESHQAVDGEIRELDKPFSNGLMYAGDPSGRPEEVINCRCAVLQRARWALDEGELQILKDRAAYYGLDKSNEFDDFKKKYLKAVEAERISKKSDFAVENRMLESREYIKKFDRMTDDPETRREYYKAAKEMLNHRSGQNGEDLYLYNTTTKKWYKSTSGTTAGTPEYTKEILDAINNSAVGELIAFHNHPSSMPPTAYDINAALKNGYNKGFALCHDGKIYEYVASDRYIDTTIYEISVAKFKKVCYNELDAQTKAMDYLSEIYGFTYKEVK